jgi:hypothetical protein
MIVALVRAAFDVEAVSAGAGWTDGACCSAARRGDLAGGTARTVGPGDDVMAVVVDRPAEYPDQLEAGARSKEFGQWLPGGQAPGAHDPGPLALVDGAIACDHGEHAGSAVVVEDRVAVPCFGAAGRHELDRYERALALEPSLEPSAQRATFIVEGREGQSVSATAIDDRRGQLG